MPGIGDRIKGAELVGLARCSARLKCKRKMINLSLGTELNCFETAFYSNSWKKHFPLYIKQFHFKIKVLFELLKFRHYTR